MIFTTRSLTAGASLLALVSTAAAQDRLPQAADSYFIAAREQLARKIADQPNVGRAKNIVLFVGDGMSIPTMTAARIYEGQSRGVDGESNVLSFEELLPYTALSKT